MSNLSHAAEAPAAPIGLLRFSARRPRRQLPARQLARGGLFLPLMSCRHSEPTAAERGGMTPAWQEGN